MIKCFFVDVKSISSDLPRSTFAESDLERLANLILETDGLLRPIIIKQVGLEQYTVIDGHREYYAAVKAKEKDSKKAEMVNAFAIDRKNEQSAIDQLKLLVGDSQAVANLDVPIQTNNSIDLFLPTIASLISEQIRPLECEIAEHKKVLSTLIQSIVVSRSAEDKILESIAKNSESILSKLSENIKPKKVVGGISSKKKVTKSVLEMLASIERDKLNSTLELVNTLSQIELSSRMKRSGIKNSENSAANIIAAREDRANRVFDSWESVVAEVAGLALATTRNIIMKLC
jgi:ParB-like nuclease domain